METMDRADAKKILMVVANSTTSPVTGWPIGFWWAELTHPYLEFTQTGYDVQIVSPKGGDLTADAYSDPEDPSGYSAQDFVSLGFKKSPKHAVLLKNTPSIGGLNARDYDAVFIVGGQSPMVTMINDELLHRFFASFYEQGKIAAAVCHGTCILLKTKLSSGKLLVDGKTWTGFANSEETYAEKVVGSKIQPFWIESEARKITNTRFQVGPAFASYAVADGNLITGQQQNSGAEAARLVIKALRTRRPEIVGKL